MAKIINWMKTIGSALLTGAKAVTVAEGMVGNLVAEGVGELFEQGFHSIGEKIKLNRLFKSIEKRFKQLVDKYGEEFLDELYKDLCESLSKEPKKHNQPASGEDYANLLFSSMESVNEETLSALPCCQNLSKAEKTSLVAAFSEFKEWLTQRLLTSMSFKEQSFVQIVAQKVVNELGGELSRVVLQLRTEFFEDSLEQLAECPNCHAAESDLEYKKAEKLAVCKKCGKSFYVGKKTDFTSEFQRAITEKLKDFKDAIDVMNNKLCEIEKTSVYIKDEIEKRKRNARINLYYAVKARNPDPKRIENAVQELLKDDPTDPFALFFRYAVQEDQRDVRAHLANENFTALTIEEKELIAAYAIDGLKYSNYSNVRKYLMRAFGTNSEECRNYSLWLEEEKQKIDGRVYDPKLPRHAFIIYVSEDLPFVEKFVEFLERQGLTCFYSERNLQHVHTNSKDDEYWNNIYCALDKCVTVVFVSSKTAREKDDGGHIKELLYLCNNHPKKPRIEYRLDNKPSRTHYRIKKYFGHINNEGVTMEHVATFVGDNYDEAESVSLPPDRRNDNPDTTPVSIGAVETAPVSPEPVAVTPAVENKPPVTVKPTPIETPIAPVVEKPIADENLGKLYKYNVLKDGTAELVLLKGAETLNLPAMVDGYKVTKISCGYYFEKEEIIKSVIIPDGVTSIGYEAFYDCENLISVTIPNSVIKIKDLAFYGCKNLKSITIPNSVTSIGNETFYGCVNLKSIIIPINVTSIDVEAFAECENLTIYCEADSKPSGWKIGWSYGVKEVVWGYKEKTKENTNNVKTPSVTPPPVDENLGKLYKYNVLKDGTAELVLLEGAETLDIPATVDGYKVTNISRDENFKNADLIKTVIIPHGVIIIGTFAFSHCSSLTSITLPDSLISIDLYTFGVCSSLTSINIPDGVTSIGNNAFVNCSSLTNITIPNSVTSIGPYAFSLCKNLTSITIPNNVTSVGIGAFEGCSSLTNITIPNSVTSIGPYAFSLCKNLTSITIPNSVTSIGNFAFLLCKNLTIYCEAAAKPSDWDDNWAVGVKNVVWGYKGN